MSLKSELRLFCKSNKTLGVPVSKLHCEFVRTHKDSPMPQYLFEKGLEGLGKSVIINLKEKCLAFFRGDCPNTYEAFIKRHEFITREFWGEITGCPSPEQPIEKPLEVPQELSWRLPDKETKSKIKVGPARPNYEEKLPQGYTNSPWKNKIDFVYKQDDPDFISYLMTLESSKALRNIIKKRLDCCLMKKEESGSIIVRERAKEQAAYEENEENITMDYPKAPSGSTKKFIDRIKKAKNIKKSDELPTSPAGFLEGMKKLSMKPKNHKDSMPLEWDKMSFSTRLEFYQNIKDKDFKDYVAAKEPKLKDYDIKSQTSKKSAFRLYVTLYSFRADKASKETKARIKELVDALNSLGRGRLQYVETLNPPTIEIREVRS